MALWVRFSSSLSMLEVSKRSVLEGLTTMDSPMPGIERCCHRGINTEKPTLVFLLFSRNLSNHTAWIGYSPTKFLHILSTEQCLASSNYWLHTPSPTSERVLPTHQRRGGTHSPGGEGARGSNFRKTPGIGLASYSIILLRQARTRDTAVIAKSREMTVRSQRLPCWHGGRRDKDDRKQNTLAPLDVTSTDIKVL